MSERTRAMLKVGLALGAALACGALALSWLTQPETGPAPLACSNCANRSLQAARSA